MSDKRDWKAKATDYALLYASASRAAQEKDKALKRVTKRWADTDNANRDLYARVKILEAALIDALEAKRDDDGLWRDRNGDTVFALNPTDSTS